MDAEKRNMKQPLKGKILKLLSMRVKELNSKIKNATDMITSLYFRYYTQNEANAENKLNL
jgi:hypothetical protein